MNKSKMSREEALRLLDISLHNDGQVHFCDRMSGKTRTYYDEKFNWFVAFYDVPEEIFVEREEEFYEKVRNLVFNGQPIADLLPPFTIIRNGQTIFVILEESIT